MGDPIPIEGAPNRNAPRLGTPPEPARARRAPGTGPSPTTPCPGCGWPVPTDAAICTRCGERLRADGPGGKAATTVRSPETLPPLPAHVGSIRWRNERIGEYSDRIPIIKCLVWIALGLGVALILRGFNPGVEDLVPYLGRFGILTAGAVVLVAASRFMFVDTDVSIPVMVLGVAGALAGAEMAQHVVRDAIPFFSLTAWPVGYIVCAGILVDLLDLEFTEGAILALVLFLLKVLLKWSVFTHFLAPP